MWVRTLTFVLCVGFATISYAQSSVRLDSKEVEGFVDSKIIPALKTSGVPGAIVAIVRREGAVLVKGYGVSDIASGTPVDGHVTLFNIASMGKGMSAIIAEQLIEEGMLDVDEDVNRYLKSAQVSGPKVTLRMLLGHRGGFDDDLTGLFVPLDGDTSMTRAELERRLVPVVPPGGVSAYDNQGYGVVGLILTDVTGKSFDELFRERLFAPAGMSGAAQGRPADGARRLARCYTVQGPGHVEECAYPLYRDGLRGAGGITASGADIARYMRLLLNGGQLDGKQILSPEAYADLTDFDHYRFHAGMPGLGRGFIQFEEFRGFEFAGGGSIPGFSSLMLIYREADVGIFVSYMGGQVGSFNLTFSNVVRSLGDLDIQPAAKAGFATLGQLADSIAEQFIPANRPRSSESKTFFASAGGGRLEDFLGQYVPSSDHSRTFIVRLAGSMQGFEVIRAGPDAIKLTGAAAAYGTLRKIAPLLYEGEKGRRVAFAELPTGRYMAVGLSGGTFRQSNAIESPVWSILVFAASLLIVLTALIQWRRRVPSSVRQLARHLSIGFLLVLVGLLAEWQWGVMLGIVRGDVLLPALWRIGLHVGAGMMLWAAVKFLRQRDTNLGWVRLSHGLMMSAAAFAVPVVLLFWRVLGAFPPHLSWQ